MRAIWILAVLFGCEREAPSCELIAQHAVEHIHARPFLSDTDRARLRIKLPFSVALTDEDRRHVERECADWSAEYKLCVIDSRGSGFHCGREDTVWSTLPHVRRWLDDLAMRASDAHWRAHERATAADLEVERLTSEVALDERTSESGPRDFERGTSYGLRAILERARDTQRKARALATTCEIRPLEQEACIALLP